MAKLYGIGETLIDLVFRNNLPVSAKPGGSVLNSLISLGRLGVDVNFISDYGNDEAGRMVDSFLNDNQVNTSFVQRLEKYKTSLALAFLDENNDANYSFYKDLPAERLKGIKVNFEEDDIFLFGSFFAISDSTRQSLVQLLTEATRSRSIIIYDPNFRKPHLPELEKVRPLILENIGFADIVRGSDEDFNLVFGANSAEEAYRYVSEAGCPNLIYTANKQEVVILGQGTKLWLEVPPLKVESTIGAGDNFNAGVIWSLLMEELNKRDMEHLPRGIWEKIGKTGISFSAEVCKRMENYISVEFAVEVLNQKNVL